MIVNRKITEMISHELDRLMELKHKPYYKMAKVDIYTGKLLKKSDPNETKNIRSVPRKVFVPDQKTIESCVRINKILLYGRDPHPASHGFERQRDLTTFIEPHKSKRRLLTISLLDAFERIGKRRIKAIGQHLLGLEQERAEYFSLLLTMRGRMAGGNPLSPQILNIQAYKTDRYLTDFCVKYRLTYTRFLDSFAFSANSFIHTEVIAKIKRIISRCGWMIDNEQVDIQSGNHFHIAGQVVVPEHILARRQQNASTQQSSVGQQTQGHIPYFERGTFGSILKNVNPSNRLPKEQNLIKSLKNKMNKGSTYNE